MPLAELADERLPSLNPGDCGLSVYLASEKITGSFIDTVHHKILSVSSFPLVHAEKNKDTWKECVALLKQKYFSKLHPGKIKIAFDLSGCVLVPSDFFEESEIKNYYRLGGGTEEGVLIKDFIPSLSAYSVYAVPETLLHELNTLAESIQF